MAECQDCNQEMLEAKSCICNVLRIAEKSVHMAAKDEFYERNNSYYDANVLCHDCEIINRLGNYHHYGCGIERCPKCGGQLISCGCFEGKDVTPIHVKMAIRPHN